MATEREKKKVQIGAVIDFCAAKGLKISRTHIFLFFGVPRPTGSGWFPSSYAPNRPQETKAKPTKSTVSSTSHEQSPPIKRQNPVRNGGRDRKKLKSMMDDLAEEDSEEESPSRPSTPGLSHDSSSPAPEDPVTPSKRRIAQPGKKIGPRFGGQVKQEVEVEIKSEDMDPEIEV